MRKPVRLLWPVFSWINFSGTLQAKRQEAEVALKEWLVYLIERLAFSDILVIILCQVLTPTGTFVQEPLVGDEDKRPLVLRVAF